MFLRGKTRADLATSRGLVGFRAAMRAGARAARGLAPGCPGEAARSREQQCSCQTLPLAVFAVNLSMLVMMVMVMVTGMFLGPPAGRRLART